VGWLWEKGERRLTESLLDGAGRQGATSYYQQDDDNDEEEALVLVAPVLDGWEEHVSGGLEKEKKGRREAALIIEQDP
jgi:hypothetical protein